MIQKYKNINSKNYDFLWRVGEMHYLFTSFWLHKEYLKRDFVVCNENYLHSFYISKKQRKILSRAGLTLFHKRFDSYKGKILKQLKITKKVFSAVKSSKLSALSNKELAEDFERAVEYWQKIWSHYFWTEYFCQDRITEILQKKDTNFDLKMIQDNVKKMGKLKYEQRKYLNQTFYPGGVFDKYAKEIEKRLRFDNKLNDYSYKEAIDMLLGKEVKIPDRSFFVKGKFSGWKDIFGEEAKEIIKQLDLDVNVKEFKGQIGKEGYYKGRVKKIEFSSKTDFYKEIKKMRKGDVLVSGSTGPEMIKACHKAGAIVTDEGGITSHAATVSRELGIPCIIGTRIATKVLKDNDLVEVDANKGIVRKIK